jgi:hypothetical protein
MDSRARRRDHARMPPLDLTDAELATAATACRAMSFQEAERAKSMENPGMREISNSRHSTAIFSPSSNRATNRSRSSIL